MRLQRNFFYLAVYRRVDPRRDKRIAVADFLTRHNQVCLFHQRLTGRTYMLAQHYRNLTPNRAWLYFAFSRKLFALRRMHTPGKS
jgi:hypothetical protein